MDDQLRAFVPQWCLDSGVLNDGELVSREATTLFVDLVGFTALTDRLGAFGSQGAEELSYVFRRFFGSVSEEVMARGGDPVAFGGDAMSIVYDGQRASTVRAAIASARAIQRITRQTAGISTCAGRVDLHTRIGIARGLVTAGVARSAHRRSPVFLGPALDWAVTAQMAAESGGVVLHPSAFASGSPSPLESPRSPPTHCRQRHCGVADDADVLSTFIHPVVLDRLAAGTALLDRHRMTTVAFMRLAAASGENLEGFLVDVAKLLQLIQDFDGELVQVSGGDKGRVAMVVFGAPVAHADDPLRAVQAMLEARRRDRSVAIGIATGSVFAALIGSERRRFPAHFGRPVNVAARLMQRAEPGQLLVASSTWRETSRHLRAEGRPFLHRVKGQAEPVEVRAISGWRRGRRRLVSRADPPMVGRASELRAVERLMDDLTQNHGDMLVFDGEPGIGLSRLVREVSMWATARGLATVSVDAADYPRGRSSLVWRHLAAALIGIAPHANRATWTAALTTAMPGAEGQFSVLGGLLGLHLDGEPASATQDPALNLELAQGLFVSLVLKAAVREPLLIVVDNAHTLDEASWRLLTSLGAAVTEAPVGVVLTCHVGEGQATPLSATAHRMRVPELAPPEARVLAGDAWRAVGKCAPPYWLPDEVIRRAGGNPLFISAVATRFWAAWQPGEPPPSLDQFADSLAALLTEQIDRLPAACQQLLNLLAVARRPCAARDAWTWLADRVPHDQRSSTEARLAEENLVRLDVEPAGIRYRLAHEALRDVIYGGMSHLQRQQIHRRLAEHLAGTPADATEVAEHVSHLGDDELARHWYPLAARSARASWNIPAAVSWWRRALPLVADATKDEGEVELAELLLITGRGKEILADLEGRNLLHLPLEPHLAHARLGRDGASRWLLTVAQAAFACGDLVRAETAAEDAMQLCLDLNEPRRQRAAELLVLIGCERGDFSVAESAARTHLDQALSSGDTHAVITAQAALGAVLLLCGRPDEASRHYDEARLGAEQAGDQVRQIEVLSDLAGCAFETGRYAQAARLLAEARQQADVIGYRRHLAFNLSNEAQLRAALGDAAASSCAAAAIQRSIELGDLAAAANALHTWLTAEPALAQAVEPWRRLSRIDSALGRVTAYAADVADLAVAAARRGQRVQAIQAAAEAEAAARDASQEPARDRATLARLLVQLSACGQGAERAALLARLDALSLHEGTSEVGRAELSIERWRVTGDPADRTAAVRAVRRAFSHEPSAVVRNWFIELNESQPTGPDPLPPPAGIGQAGAPRARLEAALAQLEDAVAHARA